MIKVINTVEEYNRYIQGGLPSGELIYIPENNSVHFRTNNIDGETKNYDFGQGEELAMLYPKRLNFQGSTSMERFDGKNIDVSYLETYNEMFYDCKNLKYADCACFNQKRGNMLQNLFFGCESLEEIVNYSDFCGDNITSLNRTFSKCNKLKTLDLSGWDVRNVTRIDETFNNCSELESLNLAGWDMRNVTQCRYCFIGVKKIVNLNLDGAIFPEINLNNLKLEDCNLLTVESLISILNALPQTELGLTLTLGANNLAKLSDAQKAIATGKGWLLA